MALAARTSGGRPPSGGPPHARWMWWVIGTLGSLYAFQMMLQIIRVDTLALAWVPVSHGGEPWTLLTRWFVQTTAAPNGVMSVIIGLAILFMFLPGMGDLFPARSLGEVVLASAVVSSLALGAADLVSLLSGLRLSLGPAFGWQTLLFTPMLTLYGLARPGATIRVWFLLPVPAWIFAWAPPVVGVITILSALGGEASLTWGVEELGTWAGAYGWWILRGPGKRRRALKKQARDIERQLTRLTVLPGGRDDVIH